MLSHFTRYDIDGKPFELATHISKYLLTDDAGREIPSLCIDVSEADCPVYTYYGSLTFGFFGFLPIKNAFYAGTQDFPNSEQLLSQFAHFSGAYRVDHYGFPHPLYVLTDECVKRLLDDEGVDGQKYRTYSKKFDEYYAQFKQNQ